MPSSIYLKKAEFLSSEGKPLGERFFLNASARDKSSEFLLKIGLQKAQELQYSTTLPIPVLQKPQHSQLGIHVSEIRTDAMQ